ncbi:glycosyltransferase [Empedobacter sp.]|uniref:glycosyltransferase n=1 Tax=Empedobacter sp. TaxID=1927715 RepID=UPI0028AACB1C|nr:glycosyltransferase [Empedobacter sp.]
MDKTLKMDNNSFVTIGIPTYNAEKFIVNTINSVLAQTYTNFELIITDDGSTDNTLALLKNISDSRIIIISDGQNKGISCRLNEQISLAKGKYFIRMDADDIMFKERVEKQISFLENNPQVDVIGSSVVIIDDENNIIGFREAKIPEFYEDALTTNVFIHPTVAGKIEWFKKYQYDEKLSGVEDFELWIRSYEDSVFEVLKEPFLFYRDPLKFKIKTYTFRLMQQRKVFRNNKLLSQNVLKKIKYIGISYLKTIFSKILACLRFENFYISLRNVKVGFELISKYENELKQFKEK